MLHIHSTFRFIEDITREVVDAPIRLLPVVRTNYHQKKKRLLIIRPDLIGDFVLFLDAFKEYRRIYPRDEWEITLLGNQIWRALAEHLPYADQYWFINTKRFTCIPMNRYRLIHQLRKIGFDLVIHPCHSRRYWLGDSLAKGSGAPQRIGSEGDAFNMTRRQKRRSDCWYTDLISSGNSDVMELERNARFMRGLGLNDFRARLPILSIPDEGQRRANAKLENLGLQKSSSGNFTDFYILFPGAGAKFRQWPVERFADLAQRIYDRYGWFGVICGGPRERLLGQRLLSLAGDIPLQNLSGETDLMELAGIINLSHIVIGNETSAVHIASAVGSPSICILGGGHFGRFMPYSVPNSIQAVYRKMDCFGCNWKCVHKVGKDKPAPCIKQIKVDQIMENMIGAASTKGHGRIIGACFR